MANKTQAKAVIDAAVVLWKNDIDNILPIGVNIKDGQATFGPTRWSWILDAGGSSTTAESLITSIVAALTTAGRASVVKRSGRRTDDSSGDGYRIETQLAVYTIINTH
jgi:hypothetical protein